MERQVTEVRRYGARASTVRRRSIAAAAIVLVFLMCPPTSRRVWAWCVGGAPPAMDEDGDDLNDLQEAFLGWSPINPDTNGNGIPDGDEDSDRDGISDKNEASIFSLEGFVDPFADPPRNAALLIEGTNLFSSRSVSDVVFTETDQSVRANKNGKYNSQVRIYLLLDPTQAATLMGPLKVSTGTGETNTLSFMPMHCDPGPPMAMGALIVQLKLEERSGQYRDYVAIGGCNLIERDANNFVRTAVRLADHDIVFRAPYGGIPLLPPRIIVPAHSLAKADPIYPFSDDIAVGDLVRVVTSAGESEAVPVAPSRAQVRIPPLDLAGDHDGDGLESSLEVVVGTDPLVYDTDHDGLSDADELNRGTDPLDPDTNGNGILDGDECP
jgi:hypothetical protein